MNMNFDFNNSTRILFGSGKLNELGNQPMSGKKAFVAADVRRQIRKGERRL